MLVKSIAKRSSPTQKITRECLVANGSGSRSGFGWGKGVGLVGIPDTTVPLARYRQLAFAQVVAPMNENWRALSPAAAIAFSSPFGLTAEFRLLLRRNRVIHVVTAVSPRKENLR